MKSPIAFRLSAKVDDSNIFALVVSTFAFTVILSTSGGYIQLAYTAPEIQPYSGTLEVLFLIISVFILPFGLAGLAIGYFIESNKEMKMASARTGYIAGFLIPMTILSLLATGFNANFAGIVLGGYGGFFSGVAISLISKNVEQSKDFDIID